MDDGEGGVHQEELDLCSKVLTLLDTFGRFDLSMLQQFLNGFLHLGLARPWDDLL